MNQDKVITARHGPFQEYGQLGETFAGKTKGVVDGLDFEKAAVPATPIEKVGWLSGESSTGSAGVRDTVPGEINATVPFLEHVLDHDLGLLTCFLWGSGFPPFW